MQRLVIFLSCSFTKKLSRAEMEKAKLSGGSTAPINTPIGSEDEEVELVCMGKELYKV